MPNNVKLADFSFNQRAVDNISMKNKGKIMIIVIAAIISILDLVILVNSDIDYCNMDMIDIAKSFTISGLIRVYIFDWVLFDI
jgi:hypothetical protein